MGCAVGFYTGLQLFWGAIGCVVGCSVDLRGARVIILY